MRKCVVLFLILVAALAVAALTEHRAVEVPDQLVHNLAKK